MIKGVFFDVGGTLYSYRNLPSTMAGLIRELAERLALDRPVVDLMPLYQRANKEVDKLYAEKPAYLFKHYFEAVYHRFLGLLGQAYEQVHFDWFEPLQHQRLLDCIVLQADCHPALDRVKAMGLYMAAVSNADENQLEPLIERGQLHRWLRHWTSSEAAQSCKPDARIFQIALQKSQLAPHEIVFVGDSLEQDIAGAHKAGMKTVLITELDELAPMSIGRETPEPDFRIKSLSELPAILDSLR